MIEIHPQTFQLDNKKHVFFDIFLKKNIIHLACPIFDNDYNGKNIEIYYENKKLKMTDAIYNRFRWQPFKLLSFQINSQLKIPDEICVTVKYKKHISKSFNLKNIQSCVIPGKSPTKKHFTFTTLFKDDYTAFTPFYDYYKKQGIDHFYMYYNGKITDKIRNVFNKSDVTLIEWDFEYRQTMSDGSRRHYTQPAHINHSLYYFGKDNSKYMLFADLDEFLYIKNKTLKAYIDEYPNIEVFAFRNIWARFKKTNFKKFPNSFYANNDISEYSSRSKCIYLTDNVRSVQIHCPHEMVSKKDPIIDKSNIMYHFSGWNKPRSMVNEKNTQFNVTIDYPCEK